ncbi:MAG: hypothetical protein ACREXT_04740, partial [Gammaproteobacteria bacterium]
IPIVQVTLLGLTLIAAMGGVSLDSLSLTGTATDIDTEWREVKLREVLTAQTGNPRLIVYVRDLESVGLNREHMLQQLPLVFPKASIEAVAINKRDQAFRLELTGYSFFRGIPGLVLEEDSVPKGETFYRLRIRSKVPLRGASLVWLDSLGRSRPE